MKSGLITIPNLSSDRIARFTEITQIAKFFPILLKIPKLSALESFQWLILWVGSRKAGRRNISMERRLLIFIVSTQERKPAGAGAELSDLRSHLQPLSWADIRLRHGQPWAQRGEAGRRDGREHLDGRDLSERSNLPADCGLPENWQNEHIQVEERLRLTTICVSLWHILASSR